MVRRDEALSISVITCLVLLFYWGSVHVYFFGEILTDINSSELIPTHYLRPIRSFIFRCMYNVFGLDVFVFRVFHLILHVCNSIFVFYIIRGFTKNGVIGLTSAVLFATFWVNTVSVSWMGAAHETQWTFFGLIAIICFSRYRDTGRLRFYVMTLVSLVLAIGIKESGGIIPMLLLLVDCWKEKVGFSIRDLKRLWPQKLYCYIPMFIVLLIVAYLMSGLATIDARGGGPTFSLGAAVDGFKSHFRASFYIVPPIWDHTRNTGWWLSLAILAFMWFRSSLQYRRHLVYLFLAVLILLLPHLLFPFGYGHIYLVSAVSVAIVAIAIYEVAAIFEDYARSRFVRLAGMDIKLVLTFAVVGLIVVSCNYPSVRNATTYYSRCGKTVESFAVALKETFPDGIANKHLVLVNFPHLIEPTRKPVKRQLLIGDSALPSFLRLHLKHYEVSSSITVPIPLPSVTYKGRNTPLKRDYWFSGEYLQIAGAKEIGPDEFDRLSTDESNEVFIFNPVTERIQNVTGLTYRDVVDNIMRSAFTGIG